jgi:hypothetical protein
MAVPSRSRSSVALFREFRVLFLWVDAMKDSATPPFTLCDNSEALGEGLVLEALGSFIGGLKRLPIGRNQDGLAGELGWLARSGKPVAGPSWRQQRLDPSG